MFSLQSRFTLQAISLTPPNIFDSRMYYSSFLFVVTYQSTVCVFYCKLVKTDSMRNRNEIFKQLSDVRVRD